jgi:putative peptidoglycan binding protein
MDIRKSLSLSAVLLAGTCIAVAPAWAQSSSTPSGADSGGKSAEMEKAPGGKSGAPSSQPGSESGRKSGSSGSQLGSEPGSKSGGSTSTQGGADSGGKSAEFKGTGGRMEGQANVKQVQEALKEKGFDPGPADGVMGQKTRDALRQFQQSKNLKATGRLDAETAQELGVNQGASGKSSQKSGARSSEGSGGMGSSGTGSSGSGSGGTGSGATGSGSSGKSGSSSPGSGPSR